MNFFNIRSLFASLAVITICMSSCDKVDTPDPLGDKGQKIVRIRDYGGLGANFGNSGLTFDAASTSESVEFIVDYETPTLADHDIIVTIGTNVDKVAEYNEKLEEQYLILPDSVYHIVTDTAIIKAGETLSSAFVVEFNPSYIDQSKNWMIPIQVKTIIGAPDAMGALSTGTAYFHFIGNPLAGAYSSDSGYFYHPTSPRVIPNGTAKTFAPINSEENIFEVGDFNGVVQGAQVILGKIKVDLATNKVTIFPAPDPYTALTQATLVPLDALPSPYTPFSGSTPSIYNNTYDPATKKLYLRYGYLGTTGWRVCEEILRKL